MKKILIIAVIFVVVFSASSIFTIHSAKSEIGNNYRKTIVVDNSGNPETLTDYQVFVNVTYNSNMQPNFDDLRFMWYNETSDQEVGIDYWLDKYIDSEYALVWVEVPTIKGLGQEVLYMYYGDANATSESNGEETFVFFDDFSMNTTLNYEIIHDECPDAQINWNSNGWLFLNVSSLERPDHCSNVYVRHKTALIDATEEKYWIETRSKANGTGVIDYFGVSQIYKFDSNPEWYYSLQCLVRETPEIQSIWGWITAWEFRRYGSIPTGKDELYRFGVGTSPNGTVVGRFYDDDYGEIETLVNQTIHQDNEWWVGLQASRGIGPEATLHAYFDYIRVRKFTDPEPSCSVGPEELMAIVNADPDTLNLKSGGRWITVYTELPEGYDVSDINVSTIMFNDSILAQMHPTGIDDEDSDGIPDLMVKFDRAEVVSYIIANINMIKLYEERFMTVTITMTGYLNDGTPFEGSDTVRIISPLSRGLKKLTYSPFF